MSNLYNLKKYLKEQATLIRSTKTELKAFQKENGGYDGGFFSTLKKLSWNFRHHHIAYSMLRGKAYEVIERPNTKILPNMDLIEEIKGAYTEDVCTSAT